MTNTCTMCVTAVQTDVVPEYNADLIGAPFKIVLLDAVQQDKCTACGRVIKTTIPDMEGLLHAIAVTRSVIPRKLSPSEIKFLRHAMGWKGKEAAAKLSMTPEHWSRVEGGEKVLSPQSEKLFRINVLAKGILRGAEISSDVAEKVADLLDMEIKAVSSGKPLTLRFYRREMESGVCGNDNGKWIAPKKAA